MIAHIYFSFAPHPCQSIPVRSLQRLILSGHPIQARCIQLQRIACLPKTKAEAGRSDQVFSADFYAPYEAAVQTAFLLICSARRRLVRETGEDIHALTFRLKSPASIRGKLLKKALPVTRAAASAALHDIAGLRVVLGDIQSVYRFAQLICASPAAEVDGERDYIETPKESGYQSLHLLLRVPVCVDGQSLMIPVELQLRTAAMDIWASVEHDLIYKPHAPSDC